MYTYRIVDFISDTSQMRDSSDATHSGARGVTVCAAGGGALQPLPAYRADGNVPMPYIVLEP